MISLEPQPNQADVRVLQRQGMLEHLSNYISPTSSPEARRHASQAFNDLKNAGASMEPFSVPEHTLFASLGINGDENGDTTTLQFLSDHGIAVITEDVFGGRVAEIDPRAIERLLSPSQCLEDAPFEYEVQQPQMETTKLFYGFALLNPVRAIGEADRANLSDRSEAEQREPYGVEAAGVLHGEEMREKEASSRRGSIYIEIQLSRSARSPSTYNLSIPKPPRLPSDSRVEIPEAVINTCISDLEQSLREQGATATIQPQREELKTYLEWKLSQALGHVLHHGKELSDSIPSSYESSGLVIDPRVSEDAAENLLRYILKRAEEDGYHVERIRLNPVYIEPEERDPSS